MTDEYQRAAPPVPQTAQHLCRADESGHVDVVAAGMHDADFIALGIFHAHATGVSKTSVLGNWQNIKISAHEDRRPSTVVWHTDQAVTTDIPGDLKARLLL